ncbi:hypothetical protein ACJJTC_008150 [Scirpophaga incertulas]
MKLFTRLPLVNNCFGTELFILVTILMAWSRHFEDWSAYKANACITIVTAVSSLTVPCGSGTAQRILPPRQITLFSIEQPTDTTKVPVYLRLTEIRGRNLSLRMSEVFNARWRGGKVLSRQRTTRDSIAAKQTVGQPFHRSCYTKVNSRRPSSSL